MEASMFKFFSISVIHSGHQLVVKTPISIMGVVFNLIMLVFAVLLLFGLFTKNPFRSGHILRGAIHVLLIGGLFLLSFWGSGGIVEWNTLTLDSQTHTATEEDFSWFHTTRKTYDFSQIDHAEVYGSHNNGSDRLVLVFADGHRHSLSANTLKPGKQAAANAINSFLKTSTAADQ
jgi:hypothetical protein